VIRRLADDGVAVLLSSHRMEDLAALCAEVTVLATGRAVFSGPVEKLAAECGDLDHRVLTSDPARAYAIAARTPGLRVHRHVDGPAPGALVVSGPLGALDALVVALVGAGVAVRELAPVVAPLEAAVLALAGSSDEEGAA
jgi:ABC-2 type transport system ATP-binding protein